MRGAISGKFAGLQNYAHWLSIFNNICLSPGWGEEWAYCRFQNTSCWHSKAPGIRISLKVKSSWRVWNRLFLFCETEDRRESQFEFPFCFSLLVGGLGVQGRRGLFVFKSGIFQSCWFSLGAHKAVPPRRPFQACPLASPFLAYCWYAAGGGGNHFGLLIFAIC